MNDKKAQKLRLIYGVCLSVLTVIVGVLFIVQVLSIYFSGAEKPFTLQIVASKLSQIQIPIWLWIAAVIGGGILWMVLPKNRQILVGASNQQKTLDRLKERLNSQLLSVEKPMPESIIKEERLRKIIWGVCIGICCVCAIFGGLYLCNPNNFPSQNLNAEIIAMVYHVLPFVAAAAIAVCAATIAVNYSAVREIDSVRKLIAENAKAGIMPAKVNAEKAVKTNSAKTLLIVRLALCAIGLGLFIYGIFNGGLQDVLIKAINICTECIGLG